jgi:hypothetical protein
MKEKKVKFIRVRCSESEYKRLIRMTKGFGSMSKFLRDYIFSGHKILIDTQTFNSINNLARSVNDVGRNINQIAKVLNAVSNANDYSLLIECKVLLEQYNRLSKEIREELLRLYKS